MRAPLDNQIKSLCRRIKRADKNAASELLNIYYADIYSYLRRLCGSQPDAEDLTQETFIKVWSSFGSFAGRSKFSTWVYRIAHNTFIDWQRRNSRNATSHREQWWQECIDKNPGPFVKVAERQLAQRIYEMVDHFDEEKRQVVHLHYYQGLSLRETAKVLDIATGTVKYRLREVFKILKMKINI
jgi:RNA polymerase sigma-70 factor (ECF subfamily)